MKSSNKVPNHIVIDARSINTSTGRYAENLVTGIASCDTSYIYSILVSKSLDFEKLNLPHNFKLCIANYPLSGSWREQIGLLRLIKSLRADLVHFGMTQQPILYRGKSITTIHDLTTIRFTNPSKNWLVFKIKQIVYKKVVKIVAKKSDCLIVPSEFVKNDLAEFTGINKNKIVVTYEAANKISEAPEPVKNLQNTQFIMYVGRPQPHKNLQRLVLAFSELKKKYPNLKLVLVGKKDVLYEQMESYVKKKKIPDIIITGFVSEGSLRWLYEHTAAYVFPSLSEGFGLPGLEAMAHGAPVVASNATCLPEVYGTAAHYFNPTDVLDMAAKIDEVISNPILRKELVERGEIQIKKYSWRVLAEQTLVVYNKILNK